MSRFPASCHGGPFGPANNYFQNRPGPAPSMRPTSAENFTVANYSVQFSSSSTGNNFSAQNSLPLSDSFRTAPISVGSSTSMSHSCVGNPHTYAGQRMPPVIHGGHPQTPHNPPVGIPPPFQAAPYPVSNMSRPELSANNTYTNVGYQSQHPQPGQYQVLGQSRPKLEHVQQSMTSSVSGSVNPNHPIASVASQPAVPCQSPFATSSHQNSGVRNAALSRVQNVQNFVSNECNRVPDGGQFMQLPIQSHIHDQSHLSMPSISVPTSLTTFSAAPQPIYPPLTLMGIAPPNFPLPPAPVPMQPKNPSENTAIPSSQFQAYPVNIPPPVCQTTSTFSQNFPPQLSAEETLLRNLLQKYECKKLSVDKKNTGITVAEFRALMSRAFHVLRDLSKTKEELQSLVDTDSEFWDEKMGHAAKFQDQLADLLNMISDPENVSCVATKLRRIKKKRERKRLQNWNFVHMKKQKEQRRTEIHRDIDRWHETLREKALQAKREEEMKKEADNILSEVRKKICEAKRTLEKLKVFEKLRQARRENAVKKGMFVLPKHDRNFEVKVSNMRDMMLKQLADYENEEKALKVMLETEQEGQREEEANWRMKRLRDIQDKRHANILSCLFGDSDPPPQDSDLYLFWQHHNIALTSVENLVSIRHMWDMFLVPPDSTEGSSIPQQWVVPQPPSSELWASMLVKNN